MAIHTLTTPAQYALILVDLAGQRGVPADVLLDGSGLDPSNLVSIGARIDEEIFVQIVERAFTLTGDRALGLHLGKRRSLKMLEILESTDEWSVPDWIEQGRRLTGLLAGVSLQAGRPMSMAKEWSSIAEEVLQEVDDEDAKQ